MLYDISIVIPVRNEEQTIPGLLNELEKVLINLKLEYEIIFVTDENNDSTWEILKIEQKNRNNIQLIKLTRSYGQHIAIIAGLENCEGRCALIMDGDLEMPPNQIPILFNQYNNGYDIVYGINKNKNQSFLGDIFSRLFNYFMKMLSDEDINFNTDMFRIISRRTIDSLLSFNEINPNIVYLMSLINYPSKAVKVDFDNRNYGNSNYSFLRKLRMAINSVLSFSTIPINLISFLGFTISLVSFFYLFIVIIEKVFVSNYSGFGFGTLAVMISFFSGVQLFAIGTIGAYISRNFMQNKKRPQYFIEQKISKD